MSGFNNRSGPNLSQYMNSLESEQDPQSSPQDDLDLSMFTNTQWFDFDSGRTTDFQPQPIKTTNLDSSSTASPAELTAPTPSTATSMPDISSSMLLQDLTSLDFTQFPMPAQLAGFPDSLGAVPTASTSPAVFPQNNPPFMQNTGSPRTGEKRKASEAVGGSPQVSAEEASRIAAEEDKRRRNTAASARFRHKKKQREQEMERKAKESEEKIAKLEGRVQTLLAENKWLKNMILEKTGGSEDVGKKLEELSAHVREIGQDKIEALASKEGRSESSSKERVSVKEEKS